METELHKFCEIIKQSTKTEDGTPTRYQVKLKTASYNESKAYRTLIYGERVTNKPLKTILMVGETGTGKTKLINAMVNYFLGVQRENKVWFEITDDQSDRTQAYSQTTIITVYGFYLQESRIDLTIIDTPGYGNTSDKNEKEIAMSFLKLCNSAETIREIHTVCLVIKASQTRLSDRQMYIYDAIQSLFGSDIVENIVLLFTNSRGAIPKNVLTAVEEAKIKCAVDDKNQPVYFMFENCQSDATEDKYKMEESFCKLSLTEIRKFDKFLHKIIPKPLKMTQNVLQQREQLEENILKINVHIKQQIDKKKNELKQIQEEEENNEQADDWNNSEDGTDMSNKNLVCNDTHATKLTLCCTVCEENCHPDCWWISGYMCSVIKKNHCTVCKNKCHYSKHIKGVPKYISKKNVSKKLVELQELEMEKVKRVIDAFHCIKALEMIALNTDSLITLQHIDFLIDELNDINEPEMAETLENIKKRAGEEKHKALEYMKRCIKSENLNSPS